VPLTCNQSCEVLLTKPSDVSAEFLH
jgi:hypothetical protein